MKQQARPVFRRTVRDSSRRNSKSSEPPAVVILYTGGTKSHLEPCGCYQEQSGGLAEARLSVVEQIREHGFPTLLVDAGNIFDGRRKNRHKAVQGQSQGNVRDGIRRSRPEPSRYFLWTIRI